MFTTIKKAIMGSNVASSIPEVMVLNKSIDNLEKNLISAKTAVSERVMQLVQNGNIEELYKLRPVVEAFNSEESSKTTITLASSVANRKPKTLKFLGKEIEQNTWRGVTESVLNILHDNDKNAFNKLTKNSDFDAKRPYFAKSPENMSTPVMLGSGTTAMYADASRITNNDFFYLKKTLKALGHDASEVLIELDPSFVRKVSSVVAKTVVEEPKTKTATIPTEAKRRPGRPRKNPIDASNNKPKRGPGRPRKDTITPKVEENENTSVSL